MTSLASESALLVIDTASFNAGIGIKRFDDSIFLRTQVGGMRAESLSCLLKELIEESGIRMADIESIAVNCGPGSHTGIRTGLAFAKGLSKGLKRARMMPVSAIETLRWGLRMGLEGAVLVQTACDSFVMEMAPGPGVMIEDVIQRDGLPSILRQTIEEFNRPLVIEKGVFPKIEDHPNVTTFENLVSVLLTVGSTGMMPIGDEVKYLGSRF